MLIHGKTCKKHDDRLDRVFRRIQESGLKLNRDKCEFRKTEIEYFGHVITSEGIRPSGSRVDAMETPTNLTDLRRFIGMVNYLGRFIPDLTSVISPMTDLLKSEYAWLWENAQADAFSRVEQLLTSAPVMIHVNPLLLVQTHAVLDSGKLFSRKREKSTNQSHIVQKTFQYRA